MKLIEWEKQDDRIEKLERACVGATLAFKTMYHSGVTPRKEQLIELTLTLMLVSNKSVEEIEAFEKMIDEMG